MRLENLMVVIFTFGCFAKVANADANVTFQLLSYVNPTFGLSLPNYFCAYQSPDLPRGPYSVASVNVPRGGWSGFQQMQQQQQQQHQRMLQQQQQPPQHLQNQPNRQYQPNMNPQNQYQQNQYQQNQSQPNRYQPNQNNQNQYQQYGNQQNQNQNQQNPYPQNQYQQQNQYQSQQLQFDPQPTQKQDIQVPNYNECKFSFSTLFFSSNDEPFVSTTGLISLPSNNATILFNQTTWDGRCTRHNCEDTTWLLPMSRIYKVKPNLVKVTVMHYGDAVFIANGGQHVPVGNEQTYFVDSFSLNLANLTPVASTVFPQPVYIIPIPGDVKVNGQPLSWLTVAVSVKCLNGFFGSSCNMTDCTIYDNNTQVCMNPRVPGQYEVCRYDHYNMQPVNCSSCLYGVSGGSCNSASAASRAEAASVTGYIVGLVILSLLLAIAIAVIIVGFCLYRKNDSRQTNSVRRNPPAEQTRSGPSSWVPTFTKMKSNGAANNTRGGYTAASTEDPKTSEWDQPPRVAGAQQRQDQQQAPARPYNFPPPPTRSSGSSTPDQVNGSRREAAV